jgi:ADP-ribosylglycohydrolase
MKYPNPLMLVRIAQGDAYGMGVEYIKPEHEQLREQALRFEAYGQHPVHKLRPGQYTDDTQMSIAVSETLLGEADVLERSLGERPFADAFVRCFKRDPRDGYARGFQALLENVTDGADLLVKIDSRSDKNGAAMRAVPIGVLADTDDVIRVATQQAKITHDTPHGILAATRVALMSHYALWEEGPLSELPEWLVKLGVGWGAWDGRPVAPPDVGMKTADAVGTLCMEEPTLLKIAERAIRWGGDVDTVLAIAWGIASARMREPLPGFFESDLENDAYGRDFLGVLGSRLMAVFDGA